MYLESGDMTCVFLLTSACFSFLFQPILSYENIFRFAFQEVPVQQVTGDVPTLRHLLEIGGEEPGLGSAHKCW